MGTVHVHINQHHGHFIKRDSLNLVKRYRESESNVMALDGYFLSAWDLYRCVVFRMDDLCWYMVISQK